MQRRQRDGAGRQQVLQRLGQQRLEQRLCHAADVQAMVTDADARNLPALGIAHCLCPKMNLVAIHLPRLNHGGLVK